MLNPRAKRTVELLEFDGRREKLRPSGTPNSPIVVIRAQVAGDTRDGGVCDGPYGGRLA